MKLKHKQYGYVEVDDVRRNQINKIIAVHIPLGGWKPAEEFEIEEEMK